MSNAQRIIVKTNGYLTQREIIRRLATKALQMPTDLVCNKKYLARRVGTDLIHLEKTIRYMATYEGLNVECDTNIYVFACAR